MILVFLTGLIIGTIAGMFSWIAAAALIETKRQAIEGQSIALVAQPEKHRTLSYPIFGAVERTRNLFRARRAMRGTAMVGQSAITGKKQPPQMV